MSPLALLALSACGGSETSSGGGFQSLSGNVSKGPLSNALVGLDYDGDGLIDSSTVRTDADGNFSLTTDEAIYTVVAVTDVSTIDASSGTVLSGITMKAPQGASVVSPTTTLMEEGNLTAAQVVSVLGLSDDIDPLTFNPFADGVNVDNALAVEKASHQIMNVVNAFASAAEGAGATEDIAFAAALNSLVEVVKTKASASGSLDLTDTADLDLIKDQAKTDMATTVGVNTTAFNSLADDTATAVENVNVIIEAITDTNLDSDTSKNIFSTTQVLADQVKTAAEAEANSVGSGNISFIDSTAVITAAENNAPTAIALDNLDIEENAIPLLIGSLNTIDEETDNGNFTYTLAGTDADEFVIDESNDQLSLKAKPDYEIKKSYDITILSTDEGGKTFSKSFEISVGDTNDAPTLAKAISDQTVDEDSAFSFQIGSDVFADVDAGDSFTYVATLEDGRDLPKWLSFDAPTRTFSGTPENDDVGAVSVKVTATDSGGVAITDTFSITVNNTNDLPTGAVTITGTVSQGEALTAVVSTLADVDGLGTLAYQWSAGGVAISGATASTLTLGESQVGKAITVAVSYTDDGGIDETVTSTATSSVTNKNDAPTGAVTISGTAKQGEALTAVVSTLADADGLGTLAYQWSAGGVAISGATASTLTLGEPQVGKAITVAVSYTDENGTDETVASTATSSVVNVNDLPTGEVTISGTAKQGEALTAVVSTLADADGLGTLAYQWSAGGVAISGATASTLTLGEPQVGKAITVAVSYTDENGTAETVASTATSSVVNVNDLPTGEVTISGTAKQGEALTAVVSTLADVDGLGTLAYQWSAGGVAISGATASTLTLGEPQVGKAITVAVSYTDENGTAETVASTATSSVVNVNDLPTGEVTISGTAKQGEALTAVVSTLADVDGLGTLAYQWSAGGVAISGATASTLTLGEPQVGKAITVAVSYTDENGTAETVASTATSSVVNVNDLPTGEVTISGTAKQGEALTAVVSTLADADGLGTLAYQWSAGGVAISGATASTLTLGEPQVGKAITVAVSYTDENGTAETVASTATSSVVNVNDLPTGEVTISGTAKQGEALTAVVSTLADVDGLGTLAYQWSAGGVAISGATASTLTLGESQVGKAITVAVSYTDENGTAETVASTATSSVVNVNDLPTGEVTISGTAKQGEALTAVVSTLADVDGLGTLAYQWSAGGVAISGATASTLTLGEPQVGKAITVAVSYTDENGTAETVASTATSSVVNVNDLPTGEVTISGTAKLGEALTAVVSTLADVDGLGTLAYQWSAGGVAISGATASTLTLGESQVGEAITVAVSYTDENGTAETVSSEAITVPLPPLFDVSIVSQENTIVTLDLLASSWADPSNDGVDSFEIELLYDPNVFEFDTFTAARGVTAIPNTTTDGTISAGGFALPPFTDLAEAIMSVDLKILDTSAPSSISLSSLVTDNGNQSSTHDFDFDFNNDLLIMSDIV